MSKDFTIGDYVLATKYSDGDPCDHFCVGFISEPLFDRIMVVDNEGKPFRANGFRRAEKITQEEGAKLVGMFPEIGDKIGSPLWWHLHKLRGSDSELCCQLCRYELAECRCTNPAETASEE